MSKVIVKFADNEIVTFKDNGQVLVAIKSICDAIGINPESAVRDLKKDPILRDWHTVRYASVGETKRINHVLLPIEYVSGWLFSINSNKVNPVAKEKLLLYKRECYRVLFEHFFGAKNKVFDNQRKRLELVKRMNEIELTVKGLAAERKECKKAISDLDTETFIQLRLFAEM